MRDYTLGNFIASLREANGFSQFQLGRLVGVTDKAVSKWENGATHPRIKTCEKLAAVFGISVDDLLSCQQGDQPMYRTTDGFDEVQLWRKARDRLYSMYGTTPPINLLCRLDSEEIAFKGKGIIRLIDLIGTVNLKLNPHRTKIRSRDYYMSTLIAWLLGATEVNPLKPHWYCPNCRAIHFDSHVKDGWDLPERECDCGRIMLRDGHDIPFEGALSYYSRNGISMSIDAASSIADEVMGLIREYYANDSRLEHVELGEPVQHSTSIESVERFVIVPNEASTPLLSNEDGSRPSIADFYRVHFPCVPITIVSSNMLENQRVYEVGTGCSLSMATLQRTEYYENVFNAMREDKPETNGITGERMKSYSDIALALDLKRPTFAELRQIMALHFGAEIWENNGQIYYQQGKAQFLELPGCREDVWEKILSHMDRTNWNGTGFPMKVMENVRLGRYTRKQRMDAETERILHEMGIEDWYIDCLKHVVYQWGRSAIIENLFRYMREVICNLSR